MTAEPIRLPTLLQAVVDAYEAMTPRERRAFDRRQYAAEDARCVAGLAAERRAIRGETGRVGDWPDGRLEMLSYE
jgi:hypothetical protein